MSEKNANEEFLKEEELALQENVRINGKLNMKGATVKLGGNDKAQLLASKMAVRKEVKKG